MIHANLELALYIPSMIFHGFFELRLAVAWVLLGCSLQMNSTLSLFTSCRVGHSRSLKMIKERNTKQKQVRQRVQKLFVVVLDKFWKKTISPAALPISKPVGQMAFAGPHESMKQNINNHQTRSKQHKKRLAVVV